MAEATDKDTKDTGTKDEKQEKMSKVWLLVDYMRPDGQGGVETLEANSQIEVPPGAVQALVDNGIASTRKPSE